jgi:ATP-dependent Lon protease
LAKTGETDKKTRKMKKKSGKEKSEETAVSGGKKPSRESAKAGKGKSGRGHAGKQSKKKPVEKGRRPSKKSSPRKDGKERKSSDGGKGREPSGGSVVKTARVGDANVLIEAGAPRVENLPKELGVIPLRDTVIFPYMIAPLVIGRQKSLRLVDEAANGDRTIGLATQVRPDIETPSPSDLYQVGTAATILKMLKFPDGSTRLLVQGIARIRLKEFTQEEPYLKALVEEIPEVSDESVEVQALLRNASGIFNKIVSLSPHLPDELQVAVMNIENPNRAADLIASNINLSTAEKQDILETFNTKPKLERLVNYLNRELQVLELGSKIQSEVKSELDKTQREYYLREQMKAIRRELGEGDERAMEIKELREKVEAAGMSARAKEAAEKEIDRLSRMPPQAAEYTVSRTYLDWLIGLPWSVSTKDVLDVQKARQILDEDHYDLEKVKERILEFLAVRKLKEETKGPILCFVGPPGVGKTSLGKSIARALGRKFTRISLGGVRDEAEIRGHRRTYVGALPGRILQGVRQSGSNNPLFMLDEVDKLGADFRGDPSAALLEVLDPEQNENFSDHYLEVPFDLSKVMFITTGNVLHTIPPALLDRMEVIELPGYTDEEKVQIARTYLVPRQMESHGLTPRNIEFTDDALRLLIAEYTREAGLRNFEREIANICRKIARKVAEGEKKKSIVTAELVENLIGPAKFFRDAAERTMVPGVATGLAWTEAGGDIIFVESSMMKGGKSLLLTGHLGDVMQESAQAALTYVRAHAADLSVPPDFYENNDIHIHVPHGGVPKDGPSAGVTIASSLVSLLTGKPVRPDVAMTGEITLKGKVLPVGGIKEKILAARRAGIKKVILPRKNEKDMSEVPDIVKQGLEFIFVDSLDEVIRNVLTK